MLSLTRKSDYGLVALGLLGQRWHAGEGPISAAQIAETYALPKALLMNVLKELARAKIVAATRGATGGYELAIPPANVTLLEVVTALEGPIQLTECADELPIVGQGCPISCGCPIRGPVRKLHRRITAFFEQVTLQDLLDEAEEDAARPVACGVSAGSASPAADCD